MILDRQNLVSWKQAITASAVSTDVIDLGPPMWTGSSGNDRDIDVIAVVETAFTAAGAATLEIQIQSAQDGAFTTNVLTHSSTGAIALAKLGVPGRLSQSLEIPADSQRYVRANYVVATGPMTAGAITVGVTASRQTNF